MPTPLPIGVLLSPLVIAATAIATLVVLKNTRAPRRLSFELGYQPDPGSSVSLTATRYVGGHPALPGPLSAPFMLLTTRHLAVFARRWGAKVFMIAWPKVEQIALLDRPQMEMALGSVRGLPRGAVEASLPEARFLRVRYEDDRGWWQNVIFELSAADGASQAEAVERFWRAHHLEVGDGQTQANPRAPIT